MPERIMDLFDAGAEKLKKSQSPLAARMRPETLAEFVGQSHLIGEGRALRLSLESDKIPSLIFWGPPGSGKTTLANIIAHSLDAHFSALSAVSAGVADLRRVVEEARERLKLYHRRTILFIDEIHRFNKSQQDAILPYVEDGTVVLIGATTENPSFEVNSALLSRAQVYVLNSLSEKEISVILKRSLEGENGLGNYHARLLEEAEKHISSFAQGDARIALNILELAVMTTLPDKDGWRVVGLPQVEDAAQKKSLRYDKSGEQHYDLISALHKTMRGSDPDAAIYWLGRMLEAGEDPLYIARRVIRFATEDVGLADPQGLVIAMAAQQAVHFLGMPEGKLALAEAVIYLAGAPKSNSVYVAYTNVQKEIARNPQADVPLHLRNAPTGLMKDLGYGKDYKYAHDYQNHFVKQQNLPEVIKDHRFYTPGKIGYELNILNRLRAWWGNAKAEASTGENQDDS
ncbi:replication-associated recombination protein A [Dehalococcoides mccartyi]|uniref:replication-associated recombination protein A n=1 Tax=Dehalococcoides mccartyi TaxID=61435 RepID=UPI00059EB774|nr:replication-associated recombination protein A [Dehalococcoides mccartyi]BAS32179.1 recombination factor protein RarA [Dehalococcoides mccartyi IBARAKI]AQW62767.1 AAA family ATPase [Dehalococcoides mccartyi]AQX73562.1 AAA family ATPase [Dehalococcoides mccartyi]KSV17691.1 ATPase AAA [Dehalococcoides mccartyi]OBW61293.1 MAG: AAA family ATPase [Dehalococcoides mccartyi]